MDEVINVNKTTTFQMEVEKKLKEYNISSYFPNQEIIFNNMVGNNINVMTIPIEETDLISDNITEDELLQLKKDNKIHLIIYDFKLDHETQNSTLTINSENFLNEETERKYLDKFMEFILRYLKDAVEIFTNIEGDLDASSNVE